MTDEQKEKLARQKQDYETEQLHRKLVKQAHRTFLAIARYLEHAPNDERGMRYWIKASERFERRQKKFGLRIAYK